MSETGYHLITDKRWRQLEPGETIVKPQWLAEHGDVVEAPAEGYPIGFAVKFADGKVVTRDRESEVQTRRVATPAEIEELSRG